MSAPFSARHETELERLALELLEGLWRTDFIAVDLSGARA